MLTTSKRVLIFSLAYHPMIGGAEVAVKEITDRISDVEFDVITLRFDPRHLEKEKIGNCTIYRINTLKNLYPFKAFSFSKKIYREKNYDAVWAIMANWAGFAALFFKLKFPEVRYILTLQEGDPISYIKRKVWLVYPLFKRIFLHADVIQTISKYLADWAREMGYRGEVVVIPNGVDLDRFKILDSPLRQSFEGQAGFKNKDKTVLITTSRLVEKNAVGDIIEALKFLPDDVTLKVLGAGPLEKSLKLRIRSLKLENRVKFLGPVSPQEIPVYLHASDVFVRPSLSEGFGNSFIEAMAAGLPVIATPVGGIVDFLKDPATAGQAATGLFCNVNDPKSIADKVMEYINNPDLTSRIVNNARKMVEEKYDWDLIANEMKTKVFDKV